MAWVLRPGPCRIGTMPEAPEGNEYSSLYKRKAGFEWFEWFGYGPMAGMIV